MLNFLKNAGILFSLLVISRLLPLPANSEPLLGLAVLAPYLSKNSFAFLLPLAVMFVSDLFIGFHDSMVATYSALAIAPFITKVFDNKYTALLGGWTVWHLFANTGQLYPPFSIEALLFDIRLLISGAVVLLIYDAVKTINQAEIIEIDFKKKHVRTRT